MLKIYVDRNFIRIWADILSYGLYCSVLQIIRSNCETFQETCEGVFEIYDPNYKLLYELCNIIDVTLERN